MEKKHPETLAALLKQEEVRGRRVRLMFQDEARFGRRMRIRRCWAPSPARPVVCNGYEREFVYVYCAVSPIEGELDWMTCRQMNTEQMTAFLAQVSAAHEKEFMLMVVDGASSHVSKDLQMPETFVCCACRLKRPNSTRRSTSGTRCGRRSSPIVCLPTPVV